MTSSDLQHRPRSGPGRRCVTGGFSTIELLVSMVIMAILFSICAVSLGKARNSRARAVCAANLHAIGIAFACYASDYPDYYPASSPTAQWEDLLRDYIHRNSFKCPADQELFPVLGSSYDWRDTGNPLTTLAGKSRTKVIRNDVSLAYEILPGWHARDQIQVLQVNSSVQLIPQDEFFADLQSPPDAP
jgi:hypothetical protein